MKALEGIPLKQYVSEIDGEAEVIFTAGVGQEVEPAQSETGTKSLFSEIRIVIARGR